MRSAEFPEFEGNVKTELYSELGLKDRENAGSSRIQVVILNNVETERLIRMYVKKIEKIGNNEIREFRIKR